MDESEEEFPELVDNLTSTRLDPFQTNKKGKKSLPLLEESRVPTNAMKADAREALEAPGIILDIDEELTREKHQRTA